MIEEITQTEKKTFYYNKYNRYSCGGKYIHEVYFLPRKGPVPLPRPLISLKDGQPGEWEKWNVYRKNNFLFVIFKNTYTSKKEQYIIDTESSKVIKGEVKV